MKFISVVLFALCLLLAIPLAGQQPHLKWNPQDQKLEKLNQRMLRLNERLNRQNASIARKIREAFPQKADSLIGVLYQTDSSDFEATEGLKAEMASLEKALGFARGQMGTNSTLKRLDLMRSEAELLHSQRSFLKNLSTSDLDLKSLSIEGPVQSGLKDLKAYNSLLKDYQTSVDQLSKSLESYVAKHPEVAAFKKEYDQLKALEKSQAFLRTDTSGLQTKAMVQQAMGKHLGLAKEKVNEFVNERISAAQESVQELKSKYESVANSVAITPQERNPLAGLPLKYRLVYQANASVVRGEQTALDVQLGLGYKLNPKMTLGLGASQRTAVGRSWEAIAIRHQAWGYRLHYEYRFTQNFFLQASYEFLNQQPKQLTVDKDESYAWQNGGLLGLGRLFPIGAHTTGSILIMYNLINRENSQFTSPWVFRFGFNIGKNNQ